MSYYSWMFHFSLFVVISSNSFIEFTFSCDDYGPVDETGGSAPVIRNTPKRTNSGFSGKMALSDEKKLIKSLLSKYEEAGIEGRPVKFTNDSIQVNYSISLIQILELDCRNQILTVNVWPKYSWIDQLLRWDPADYSNVTIIRVPHERIWTPDIVLYNYADQRLKEHRRALVLVTHEGETQWIPPAILKSSCKIDISYFPFDVQTCHLKFGSWTYDSSMLDIQPFVDKDNMSIILEDYTLSNEWYIIASPGRRFVKKYKCCTETFPDLTFFLFLRRNSSFIAMLLGLPCVLLSSLVLVIFWLPPQNPAKMQLGMNIFVAFFLLLLLLAENIPSAANKFPLLGYYYCLNMVLITTSTFLAVIVINLYFRGDRTTRMPRCLRIWTVQMGCLLLIKQVKQINTTNEVVAATASMDKSNKKRSAPLLSQGSSSFGYSPGGEDDQLIQKISGGGNGAGSAGVKFMGMPTDNGFMNSPPDYIAFFMEQQRNVEMNRRCKAMQHNLESIRDILRQHILRMEGKERSESLASEWRMLAYVLDRIFFFCYLGIIILAAFVLVVPREQFVNVAGHVAQYEMEHYATDLS